MSKSTIKRVEYLSTETSFNMIKNCHIINSKTFFLFTTDWISHSKIRMSTSYFITVKKEHK